jgi:hypothetical protein
MIRQNAIFFVEVTDFRNEFHFQADKKDRKHIISMLSEFHEISGVNFLDLWSEVSEQFEYLIFHEYRWSWGDVRGWRNNFI